MNQVWKLKEDEDGKHTEDEESNFVWKNLSLLEEGIKSYWKEVKKSILNKKSTEKPISDFIKVDTL